MDLNRAGVPLMEIVFEPDLSSGEEAASLLRELSLILTRLGVCSCKPGALRCDANISIHKPNEPLGIRSEVKNVASVRAVAKAVEFEIARHIEVIENGDRIVNETRSWDDETGTTIRMRDKEVVQVLISKKFGQKLDLNCLSGFNRITDLCPSQICRPSI